MATLRINTSQISESFFPFQDRRCALESHEEEIFDDFAQICVAEQRPSRLSAVALAACNNAAGCPLVDEGSCPGKVPFLVSEDVATLLLAAGAEKPDELTARRMQNDFL